MSLDVLIEEHRLRPFGPHSDGLARLLSHFRGAATSGKHIIYGLPADGGWLVARMDRPRSGGRLSFEPTIYRSCEDAEHAVLLARVAELRTPRDSA
jgi:hypothetical protein